MSEKGAVEGWPSSPEVGSYPEESPVPFVYYIISHLGEAGKHKTGLYINFANGRNYLPMVRAGLDIYGMDSDRNNLDQLRQAHPDVENHTFHGNFASYNGVRIFDYIVAMQSFQYGNVESVNRNLQQAHDVLRPNGRLFIRVNSSSTQLAYKNKLIEGDDETGKTVLYEDGPRRDQEVHFFAENELKDLCTKHHFQSIIEPYEVIEQGKAPAQGKWAQWETVWQRLGE